MQKLINWILVVPTVVILFYNAYIKLTSNPGAIQLFSGLRLEPYGRVLIGTLEVLAALLLLYPPTLRYGAALATLLMSGVIFIHVSKIGIALNGDYSFFAMGLVAFGCAAAITYINFKTII